MKKKYALLIIIAITILLSATSYFVYNQFFQVYDHIPNNESLIKAMNQAEYLEVGSHKRLSNHETILLYSNEIKGSFIFILDERMLISDVYFTNYFLTNIYHNLSENKYKPIFNIYNNLLNHGYTLDFTKQDQLIITKLDDDFNHYPNKPISYIEYPNSNNELLAKKEISEALFITIKLNENQKSIVFDHYDYKLIDFENVITIRNR